MNTNILQESPSSMTWSDYINASKQGKTMQNLYYRHAFVLEKNLIKINKIKLPADIVQVDNYLYYLVCSDGEKIIPYQLYSYNMKTDEVKCLYKTKYNKNKIDLATDGENIYFYEQYDEKTKQSKILKYSIKDNKIESWPYATSLEKKDPYEHTPGYAYKGSEALKLSLVKRKSSIKAWKAIEKYYLDSYNWFVDDSFIYFIIKSSAESSNEEDRFVYKAINLKTGDEKDVLTFITTTPDIFTTIRYMFDQEYILAMGELHDTNSRLMTVNDKPLITINTYLTWGFVPEYLPY